MENNYTKTEKRSGRRINSADGFVVLLCLVCIVGMVLRFGVLDAIEYNATHEAATVTVLIEGVSETSRGYIAGGDEVFLKGSGMRLGTVSSIVSVTPSNYFDYSDDGSINQMQSVNGRVDIRAVITVDGSMTESGFLLDGTTYIAPNMMLSLYTASLSVSALVVDLTPIEK